MQTRRQFMRRGVLLAAGGLAVPAWARWLGEQMERLQPRKHVQLSPVPTRLVRVQIKLMPDGKAEWYFLEPKTAGLDFMLSFLG